MKFKSLIAATLLVSTTAVFAGTGFGPEDTRIIREAADGFAEIRWPKDFNSDADAVTNRGACTVSGFSVALEGVGTAEIGHGAAVRNESAIRGAQMRQQAEMDAKTFCPFVTLNGVSITVKNSDAYNPFPVSFSGFAFDFSKSTNRDFLAKVEKLSQSSKVDKNVLFVKWLTDRGTISVGHDNIGTFAMNADQVQLGAVAIAASHFVQQLALNADPRLDELKAAFERDVAKGWNPDVKNKVIEQKLASEPSWFLCEQRGKKIVATEDVTGEQIAAFAKSQENSKMYFSLEVKNGTRKEINPGDKFNDELKYDSSYFDKSGVSPTAQINTASNVLYSIKTGLTSIAWTNETIVEKDPTLLWIGEKTFANDPTRCEQLMPVANSKFLADPKNVKSNEYPNGVWIASPASGCSTVGEIEHFGFSENKLFGYKRMPVVRGESIEQKGVYAFGDGVQPKVFYAGSMEVCRQLLTDGGLKIGKWFFKNRTEEDKKAAIEAKADEYVEQFFPKGLWISNSDGSCSAVTTEQLRSAANELHNRELELPAGKSIDSCRETINIDGGKAESTITTEAISGSNLFLAGLSIVAGRPDYIAKNGIHERSSFEIRDCGRAIWNDFNPKAKNEFRRDLKNRQMTFVTKTKGQCEELAKSYKTLDFDSFSKQNLQVKVRTK